MTRPMVFRVVVAAMLAVSAVACGGPSTEPGEADSVTAGPLDDEPEPVPAASAPNPLETQQWRSAAGAERAGVDWAAVGQRWFYADADETEAELAAGTTAVGAGPAAWLNNLQPEQLKSIRIDVTPSSRDRRAG